MNVEDKVIVVTGGASGIGLALCTRLAPRGRPGRTVDLRREAAEAHAAAIVTRSKIGSVS